MEKLINKLRNKVKPAAGFDHLDDRIVLVAWAGL